MLTDYWLGYSMTASEKRHRIRASFHHDVEVLYGYLARYVGVDVRELLWQRFEPGRVMPHPSRAVTAQVGRLAEAIMLPSMLGLDPREDEVAEWARLFLPTDEYADCSVKSQAVIAARRFHRAGVPAAYAATYYVRGMKGPTQRLIISAYHEGLAPEYVRIALSESW
jgi:hypothetical protein